MTERRPLTISQILAWRGETRFSKGSRAVQYGVSIDFEDRQTGILQDFKAKRYNHLDEIRLRRKKALKSTGFEGIKAKGLNGAFSAACITHLRRDSTSPKNPSHGQGLLQDFKLKP